MGTENKDEPISRVTSQLIDILSGLQRQREELGSVADELLDLFRAHGVTLPPEPGGKRETTT